MANIRLATLKDIKKSGCDYLVAPFNATDDDKELADLVLDGETDSQKLSEFFSSMIGAKTIKIFDGTILLKTDSLRPGDNKTIIGSGNTIITSDTVLSDAFTTLIDATSFSISVENIIFKRNCEIGILGEKVNANNCKFIGFDDIKGLEIKCYRVATIKNCYFEKINMGIFLGNGLIEDCYFKTFTSEAVIVHSPSDSTIINNCKFYDFSQVSDGSGFDGTVNAISSGDGCIVYVNNCSYGAGGECPDVYSANFTGPIMGGGEGMGKFFINNLYCFDVNITKPICIYSVTLDNLTVKDGLVFNGSIVGSLKNSRIKRFTGCILGAVYNVIIDSYEAASTCVCAYSVNNLEIKSLAADSVGVEVDGSYAGRFALTLCNIIISSMGKNSIGLKVGGDVTVSNCKIANKVNFDIIGTGVTCLSVYDTEEGATPLRYCFITGNTFGRGADNANIKPIKTYSGMPTAFMVLKNNILNGVYTV